MAQGTAARRAALQILRRVRQGKPFDIAHHESVEGLEDRDRRLAHEIAAGVLRSRSDLDRRLRILLTAPWHRTSSDLKDVLRIGAYQLIHLDRVPPYAAVQATVEVAKDVSGAKSGSVVNAVLRRLTQQSPDVSLCAGSETDGLAAVHSHPTWLVARWVRQYGTDRTRGLLEHNNRRPPLVIQPARWPHERLKAALDDRGIPAFEAPFGGLIVRTGRVRQIPGYAEGSFIVQDPAQARLLRFAAVPDNAVVWDACAAPGGKAAILGQTRAVVATDSRRDRVERMEDTLRRTAPLVRIALADARDPPVDSARIDVVLIDAPCTATGTLARHPDGRWRLSEGSIERMAQRQAELLEGACQAVRQGGLLVYLTCSLESEENEDQVALFLSRHPDFEREGDDCTVFPTDSGTDGGFAARLRRVR